MNVSKNCPVLRKNKKIPPVGAHIRQQTGIIFTLPLDTRKFVCYHLTKGIIIPKILKGDDAFGKEKLSGRDGSRR